MSPLHVIIKAYCAGLISYPIMNLIINRFAIFINHSGNGVDFTE